MMKTVFFSFAHPDDETFTTGGVITRYAKKNNVKTIVYSATHGDAGKCGNPPICTKEELANVRKKELEQATSILGVDELIVDTFKDGTLLDLEENILYERVRELLLEYKPEIIVTFPPHGISGHRDHTAIQEATLKAMISLKNSINIEALYYAAIPQSFVEQSGMSIIGDPDETIDVSISLTMDERENIRQALLAHKTQHLSVERVFPTIYNTNQPFHRYNNFEYYIRIWKKEDFQESSEDLLPAN